MFMSSDLHVYILCLYFLTNCYCHCALIFLLFFFLLAFFSLISLFGVLLSSLPVIPFVLSFCFLSLLYFYLFSLFFIYYLFSSALFLYLCQLCTFFFSYSLPSTLLVLLLLNFAFAFCSIPFLSLSHSVSA